MLLSSKDSEEITEYLLNVPKFAGKNTLEDTQRFLTILGSPEENKKIIHVAGTNGKGSVCAYLCSVLQEAGYRVGMFTSPHLVEIRERFRVEGAMISPDEFVQAFETVMEKLPEMQKSCGNSEYHPSFFEFLFLMAMVIFEKREVEYIVLETGLGGRLDATNAVKHPCMTVITEIGMDHMEYLGDTIGKIAAEKAGIMKPGVPVVFCDKRKEATEVIEKQAQVLKNMAFSVKKEDCVNVIFTNKSIDFSFHSRYYDYISLKLNTRALYQVENAALAVSTLEELRDEKITRENIAEGIAKTVWEGRMEEVEPGVFVDGAHNEDGIRAFMRTASAIACKGRRYLLFSVVADKEYESMICILKEKPLFDLTVVAKLKSMRAATLDSLHTVFDKYADGACIYYENTEEALKFLMKKKEEQDHIYIVGSLYLVGEVKALLRRRTDD